MRLGIDFGTSFSLAAIKLKHLDKPEILLPGGTYGIPPYFTMIVKKAF